MIGLNNIAKLACYAARARLLLLWRFLTLEYIYTPLLKTPPRVPRPVSRAVRQPGFRYDGPSLGREQTVAGDGADTAGHDDGTAQCRRGARRRGCGLHGNSYGNAGGHSSLYSRVSDGEVQSRLVLFHNDALVHRLVGGCVLGCVPFLSFVSEFLSFWFVDYSLLKHAIQFLMTTEFQHMNSRTIPTLSRPVRRTGRPMFSLPPPEIAACLPASPVLLRIEPSCRSVRSCAPTQVQPRKQSRDQYPLRVERLLSGRDKPLLGGFLQPPQLAGIAGPRWVRRRVEPGVQPELAALQPGQPQL